MIFTESEDLGNNTKLFARDIATCFPEIYTGEGAVWRSEMDWLR